MPRARSDLWTLTTHQQIDPDALASALEAEAHGGEEFDFRTQQLIQESMQVLAAHWGEQRFRAWLNNLPEKDRFAQIQHSHFGRTGFPSLRRRVMPTTKPDEVCQFLRELGS